MASISHRGFTHLGMDVSKDSMLACSRHHNGWHGPGWHLKLLPDGDLHLTAPDGRFFITRPPP